MTPERYQEIKNIFIDAIAQPVANREQFVKEQCKGDLDLYEQVKSMLVSHENKLSLPDNLFDIFTSKDEGANLRTQVGDYRILEKISDGGFGVVYLAVLPDPHKKVAIKLPKPGVYEQGFSRFRTERQILSAISGHENIVKLLHAGVTEDNLPYFAMEYIFEGIPITKYCDDNNLNVHERLKMFRRVCAAIEYIHELQIVHCDIKPSNILVDVHGVPKLIDFGVAKSLNPEHSLFPPSLTLKDQQMLLTPAYASPEQIYGGQVIYTSDIYSLGVLLYELLTGCRPYNFKDNFLIDEMKNVFMQTDPKKPSVMCIEGFKSEDETKNVTSGIISKYRSTTSSLLKCTLHGEIDTIVMKAICKEPKCRYQSVKQLSFDIDRYLSRTPINQPDNYIAISRIKHFFNPLKSRFVFFVFVVSLVLSLAHYDYLEHCASILKCVGNITWNESSKILIGNEQQKKLSNSIGRLINNLDTILKQKIQVEENFEPWSVSQMVISLDSDIPISVRKSVANKLVTKCDPEGGWKEIADQNYKFHIPASAWALLAMKKLGQPTSTEHVNFILNSQKPEGWWPVYRSENNRHNASTYATAMAVMALYELLVSGKISLELKPSVITAIEAGKKWLMTSARQGLEHKTSWWVNPYVEGRVESIGLSGLVLHVMHRVQVDKDTLKSLDKQWLSNLPSEIPIPSQEDKCSDKELLNETGGLVFIGNQVRCYKVQWILIATTDAYLNGTIWQKAKAMVWINDMLEQDNAMIINVTENYWIAAELLISLRYIQGELII